MLDLIKGVGGGYLAALAVHLLLTFLITREGRGILMADGGMSRAFYLQAGLSWMMSGIAGAAVALYIFPQMPMAGVSLAFIAVLLCVSLFRIHSKAPHQQTAGDTLLMVLCVLVGFGVPSYLHFN